LKTQKRFSQKEQGCARFVMARLPGYRKQHGFGQDLWFSFLRFSASRPATRQAWVRWRLLPDL